MWNYRIIKDKDTYGLYEVMYNDDGEIFAHSEEPELVGENPEDLLETLQLMISDVKKHFNYFFPPEINKEQILELDKIKFAKPCEDYDKGEEITMEELDDLLNEDK